MKLIIAEKPSVARDIARVISGGTEKAQKLGGYTYYKAGEYLVANARGHLVRLAEPQEYAPEWEKWSLPALPMIPENFKLRAIDDGKDWLDALKQLMKSDEVTSLICATDAGREGELIFRFIYYFTGCKKPFERLWISSMTDESIKNGLANLLPGESKDSMYRAGITRAKIDWLIGMNLSRLYSIYFHTGYSIGRVQTAAVNMIVEREREIKNFVKKPFYKLFLDNGAEWFDGDTHSFSEKAEAQRVKADCDGQPVTVTKAETKQKSENRPLLYSLTALQIDANEQHGYSAAFTLQTAQELYEKKLLTYPRTDSSYITDDMPPTVTSTLEKLRFFDNARVDKLIGQGLNFDKRVVNNKGVSDHHALLPTANIDKMPSAGLTEGQENVMKLVIERLMTALDAPYTYDEASYTFECMGNTFSITGKTPVNLGWRQYSPPKSDKSDTIVLAYSVGDKFTANNIEIKDCETEPPKHFTESTLLSAMENIGRRIEDKEKRKFVKERGLGTPATRASIIERVINQNYVERVKKTLVNTLKGEQMIDSVPEDVKSVELTADMEQRLADIESGAASEQEVFDETLQLINKVIEREKTVQHENRSDRPATPRESLGKCPRCGGDVFEGKENFYCVNFSRKTCIFSVFKDNFFFKSKKKTLTKTIIKALLKDGVANVEGFYSETKQKEYSAAVVFRDRADKNGVTRVGFDMKFNDSKGSKP